MALAYSIVKYVISVSDVAVNSFLLYALWKRKKLKIVSFWLVFCLSISDVCFGLFAFINESFNIHFEVDWCDELSCFITDAIEFFFVNFSTAILFIISIDRFTRMKYPMQYNAIMTKKRAVVFLCINVILSGHLVVLAKFLPKYHINFLVKNLQSYIIYLTVVNCFYLMAMISICGIYVLTYFTIKKRIENRVNDVAIERREPGAPIQDSNMPNISTIYINGRRRPDQEFAVCIMVVIVLLLFCDAPNIICNLYSNVLMLIDRNYTSSEEMLLGLDWTYLLLQVNSTLNAVIILYFNRELRAFARQTFAAWLLH